MKPVSVHNEFCLAIFSCDILQLAQNIFAHIRNMMSYRENSNQPYMSHPFSVFSHHNYWQDKKCNSRTTLSTPEHLKGEAIYTVMVPMKKITLLLFHLLLLFFLFFLPLPPKGKGEGEQEVKLSAKKRKHLSRISLKVKRTGKFSLSSTHILFLSFFPRFSFVPSFLFTQSSFSIHH